MHVDQAPSASLDLARIYETAIRSKLMICEAKRRRALGLFALAIAAGVGVVAIEWSLLSTPVWIVVGFISFDAAFLLGYWPLSRAKEAAKAVILGALSRALGLDYRPNGESPALEGARRLRLVPREGEPEFGDIFSGQRGSASFELCEVTVVVAAGREEKAAFAGEILHLSTRRQIGSTILVMRRGAWAMAFERPPGLEPVGLEDPVFNSTFSVFASDQVEAREILTPLLMQRLADLETTFAGENLRCCLSGSDVWVVVESRNRFEIATAFDSLMTRAPVEAILNDLAQMLALVEAFEDV